MSTSRTSWRIMVGLAAAGGLVVVGWFGWSAGRAAWLRREADAAAGEADWRRAADRLDRYLWYRPGDAEAIRGRVEIAEHLGDPAAAIAWLGRVPAGASEAASASLRRGLLLKALFRIDEAERAFREAIARDPGAPEPRRELVAILGIERRAAEQEAELWGLHDAGAEVEALRLLGQSAVVIPPGTLSKMADEGAVLARCLDADPDTPHVRPALARFHRMRGEIARAIAVLDPGLRARADDRAARVEWLACKLDAGDMEIAAAWFEPPKEDLSRLADYRRLRGDWLALQGRQAEALADYREAVRLAPRDPEARYRLAMALRAAGRRDEAEESLAIHRRLQELATRAAAVNPEAPDPVAIRGAGEACAALGPEREREARAWFALLPGGRGPRGGPPGPSDREARR